MSDTGINVQDSTQAPEQAITIASAGDYIALLKPRVMSLVIFTALVGMMIAPGAIHPVLAFAALLSIAVGAGASGALNMWYDADIDAIMSRTRQRPIPAGRVQPGQALGFGIFLSCGSVLVLGMVSNLVAAGLLAFTIFFYAVIYTIWLKRWTVQNIVIGGVAGALPPVVAYAAVTGTVTVESLTLFVLIFFWTPPHFWALALFRSADYEKAGVPMLPVVAGEHQTRIQILVYTIVLAPIGVAPFLLGFAGVFYCIAAVTGGCAMLWMAIEILRKPQTMLPAKRMFGGSIIYLFALFAVLLAETFVARIMT